MTSGLTCGFALGIFTFFNWIQGTDFTNIVGGVGGGRSLYSIDLLIFLYFVFVEQEGGGGGGSGYGMIKHQIKRGSC